MRFGEGIGTFGLQSGAEASPSPVYGAGLEYPLGFAPLARSNRAASAEPPFARPERYTLGAVALGGELAVPCTPHPPYGRLNSHQRLRELVARASQSVPKAGSRASQRRESGQVRKEAALSGERQCRGVTWPEPAARKARRIAESMVGARPYFVVLARGVGSGGGAVGPPDTGRGRVPHLSRWPRESGPNPTPTPSFPRRPSSFGV